MENNKTKNDYLLNWICSTCKIRKCGSITGTCQLCKERAKKRKWTNPCYRCKKEIEDPDENICEECKKEIEACEECEEEIFGYNVGCEGCTRLICDGCADDFLNYGFYLCEKCRIRLVIGRKAENDKDKLILEILEKRREKVRIEVKRSLDRYNKRKKI